jgi:putative secretion ATPase (PEP-CTERM system associated)
MYERFYRLRERPFALTPDPDYLYPSRVHREALSYLRYGIESQAGFVVITGAIGSGKTTLLQTLLRGLDNQTTVARVMNTLLDPRELIEAAMIDLGLDPTGKSKPAMLKEFGEFLVNERAAGRLVLLVIDEAQNLSLPALEEIRMLSNLETEKSKLLQIVLIGQPDLRDKLARPELEQLRQRITVSYHLHPLDADETSRYVNHRLARASIGAPLEFGAPVTDRIHARSGGVPRLINVIADATLVYGYGEERCEIDEALVVDVIADLDETGVLGPMPNAERHESVVPADAPVASGFSRTSDADVASGFSRTSEAAGASRTATEPAGPSQAALTAEVQRVRAEAAALINTKRELAELERQLRQREQEMTARERELIEQRRVLAEQYRILPTAAAQAAARPAAGVHAAAPHSAGPATTAAPHRPSTPVPPTWPPPASRVQPVSRSYRIYQPKRQSFWRRMKHTLLGGAPVLEDSL